MARDGLSVINQLDLNIYFCLSTITAQRIKNAGLNLSVRQLQELAKKSEPFQKKFTGVAADISRQKLTNIYRYEDFKKYSYLDFKESV